MKTDYFIGSLVFLAVSLVGYMYLLNSLQTGQFFGMDMKGGYGTLVYGMDNKFFVQIIRDLQIFLLIGAVVSIGFMIFGIVSREKDWDERKVNVSHSSSGLATKTFCRFCGRLGVLSTNFCSGCGKSQGGLSDSLKKCRQCGKEINSESEFCGNCGWKFQSV